MKIKDLVYNADGTKQRVNISYVFNKAIWYKTDCGFVFPVPFDDLGTTTFHSGDSAPLFIRWIRKHIEFIQSARTDED